MALFIPCECRGGQSRQEQGKDEPNKTRETLEVRRKWTEKSMLLFLPCGVC